MRPRYFRQRQQNAQLLAAMTSKFYYVCAIQYYSDQWHYHNNARKVCIIENGQE